MASGLDGRPFRGRPVQNIVPSLHQRHKSTGNLKGNMYASNFGFRGPAKRAAFGDVTNIGSNLGNNRVESKVVKPRASTSVMSTQFTAFSDKENASHNGKNASSTRASHKPDLATIPSNAPVTVHAYPEPISHGYPSALPADLTSEPDEVELVPTDTRITDVRESSGKCSNASRPVLLSQPLQPRHHKSQPYLKQQPPLRRTQSGQLGKNPGGYADEVVVKEAAPGHDMGIVVTKNAGIDISAVASGHFSSTHGLAERHGEMLLEAPMKLSGIPEERSPGPEVQDDLQQIILPEQEEYWEGEEDEEFEEFDDMDQNYTTAHSVKSRDVTTGGATTVVAPIVNTRIQKELEDAKRDVEANRSEDDEFDEAWDVSMVAEYGDEIFAYMGELEIQMAPNPHYMDAQTEIQWSMRSVLMDWLVQVHSRFNLLPETLFLTVNYIDRFLSSKIVSIGKLQLVGATAILVASKYEEINCPSLSEIIYMVDGGYTMDELLKAERFMLSMLGFELGWPGPMSFLRRVSKADDYDLETRTLAKYFLELTIMDERFVASPPSFLAAAAHCLSRLILNKGDWTKAHVHYSGYTWGQLRPLVTMMIECCECPRDHHCAIFDKYSEKRFKEASLVVQDALEAGFSLPQRSAPVRNTPMASKYAQYEVAAPA